MGCLFFFFGRTSDCELHVFGQFKKTGFLYILMGRQNLSRVEKKLFLLLFKFFLFSFKKEK